jgi:hypothetical protein
MGQAVACAAMLTSRVQLGYDMWLCASQLLSDAKSDQGMDMISAVVVCITTYRIARLPSSQLRTSEQVRRRDQERDCQLHNEQHSIH